MLGIGDTTKPAEAVEGYEHPSEYREYGIDQCCRVARVELNPEAPDVMELTVNIIVNRDLQGRRLPAVDDTRDSRLGRERSA